MARKPQENPKAEMTPMIDVVFQLMIFFVVTIKQEDIYSKLNANRPAPNQASRLSRESSTIPVTIIWLQGIGPRSAFTNAGFRTSPGKKPPKFVIRATIIAAIIMNALLFSRSLAVMWE